MHHCDEQQGRGMRLNYSCNSLAAAEQLGALMQHSPAANMDNLNQQRQAELYGGALGGMYDGGGGGLSEGIHGAHPGMHDEAHHAMSAGGLGGGAGFRDTYNSVLDHVGGGMGGEAFAHQQSLAMMLRSAREFAREKWNTW